MKYCIFIDESGDFESTQGNWLISGFLCSGSYDKINPPLEKLCEKLAADVAVGKKADFHLTEFRRKLGHANAVDIAGRLMKTLEHLPFKYHLMTAINHSKTQIIDREKTYRLMLFDLIAMVETVLPENEQLDGLELIVATRTINGVRQTSASEIKEGVFNLLPQFLEVDLATKGLVDLIGKKISINLDYANNSWGLIIADFVANLSYHNNREAEFDILRSLMSKGILNSFYSFRNHKERRAAVAERDRDYATACVRWLTILNENFSVVAEQGLRRSLLALTSALGESGSKIAFEALLDRIYRLCKPKADHRKFISLINLLKETIKLLQVEGTSDLEKYLYRTNVLLLKVVNHVGKTPLALELLSEQSALIKHVAFDPDNLFTILDGSLVESEIFFNSLDHKEALSRAKRCLHLTENYTTVASLILDDESNFDKYQSRVYIKAKMNYLRHAVKNSYDVVELQHFLEELNELENKTNEQEKSRFRNIKTHLLINMDRFGDAINVTSPTVAGSHSEFDKISYFRALSTAWLNGITPTTQQKAHAHSLSKTCPNDSSHPKELLYRELSIWYYLEGHPKLSLKYAKMSRNSKSSNDARISDYLRNENLFLVDLYKSNYSNANTYFDEFGFNTKNHENAMDALKHLLKFSPF